MILPSDKYSLLLLADWLEEYGSSYDIVKATAIRNGNYNLDYRDKCYNIIDNNEWGHGCSDIININNTSYSWGKLYGRDFQSGEGFACGGIEGYT